MKNENNYLMYWVIRFSESLKITPIVRSNEILFSLQYVVNSLILSTNFEIGAPICFRDENRSSWSSIKILFSYGNFFEIESMFDTLQKELEEKMDKRIKTALENPLGAM